MMKPKPPKQIVQTPLEVIQAEKTFHRSQAEYKLGTLGAAGKCRVFTSDEREQLQQELRDKGLLDFDPAKLQSLNRGFCPTLSASKKKGQDDEE